MIRAITHLKNGLLPVSVNTNDKNRKESDLSTGNFPKLSGQEPCQINDTAIGE